MKQDALKKEREEMQKESDNLNGIADPKWRCWKCGKEYKFAETCNQCNLQLADYTGDFSEIMVEV